MTEKDEMPIEIDLDVETSERVNYLAKHIKSVETQNRIMAGLHMFMLMFCLTLLFSFWGTESPASSIMPFAVIVAGLIDAIVYKTITGKNNDIKKQAEQELKQILDKALAKGKILDKTI